LKDIPNPVSFFTSFFLPPDNQPIPFFNSQREVDLTTIQAIQSTKTHITSKTSTPNRVTLKIDTQLTSLRLSFDFISIRHGVASGGAEQVPEKHKEINNGVRFE